jgi:hypothetical protein
MPLETGFIQPQTEYPFGLRRKTRAMNTMSARQAGTSIPARASSGARQPVGASRPATFDFR